MGTVLQAAVRGSDFVGRHGGEEFLILLPETGREAATVAAEKIRSAVTKIVIPGVERSITASLGCAVFPDDAGDVEMLFRAADRALYTAKANGRNRVEVATAGEDRPVEDDPREAVAAR